MNYINRLSISPKKYNSLSYQRSREDNIIFYEAIYSNKNYCKDEVVFNLWNVSSSNLEKFKESLNRGFHALINKDNAQENSLSIKECFEIGCYILYDRQILYEVIEKQKNYEADYVIDFFRYVMKIFIKRYNNGFILSKTQCADIRHLCFKLLEIAKSTEQDNKTANRMSAKEIVECMAEFIKEKDDRF